MLGVVVARSHFESFYSWSTVVRGVSFSCGWQPLEQWTFVVPEWIYPLYGISFMFISELAGLYVLRTFVMEDFEGMIPVWRYRILQMAFFALFATYIYLMSTGWDIPYLNVLYFF